MATKFEEEAIKKKVEDYAELDPVDKKIEVVDRAAEDLKKILNSFSDMEIEVIGGQDKVKEKAGFIDKQIKLRFADAFRGEEGKHETYARIAHKEVEKRLSTIEATAGRELLQKKENLAKHKSNAEYDMKVYEGTEIYKEDELKAIAEKLEGERSGLAEEVKDKSDNLESELDLYREPAIEKQAELTNCLAEFKGYYDSTVAQRKEFAKKVSTYERALKSLRTTEGETTKGCKEKIQEELDIASKNLTDLQACEQALKERYEAVKANKQAVDNYLNRINSIGKTPAEIRKERENKRKEAAGETKTEEKTENGKPEPEKAGKKEAAATNRESETAESVETDKDINQIIIEKSVDEWVNFFITSKLVATYDKRKNKGRELKNAIKDHFKKGGRELSNMVDSHVAIECFANFLKSKTSEYKEKSVAKADVQNYVISNI